jgi:hypothetical protein
VLLWYRERGREQSWLVAGELEVRRTDSPQSTPGRGGIAVLPTHAGYPGGHALGELLHGRRADRAEQLVTVGEVPVGGVWDHTHDPCRFAQHYRVGAAGAG